MKTPFFFLLIFFTAGLAIAQIPSHQKTLNILPQSQLLISGDTNISEFSCNFESKMLPSNCAVTFTDKGNAIAFRNAVLVLNNRGFDCGNKQINKDFHALLQTGEHPSIILELKEISLKTATSAVARVNIKIAGKEKLYELPVKVLSTPATCFEGKLQLDINDFGLEPPKKAFGLIKVKEDIEVSFNLMVAEQENL